LLGALCLGLASIAHAQEAVAPSLLDAAPQETAPEEGALAVPEKVDVEPLARDPEIEQRLQGILSATEWFEAPHVEVREGVAFLSGTTRSEQFKT
jgi:hypothetical protein